MSQANRWSLSGANADLGHAMNHDRSKLKPAVLEKKTQAQAAVEDAQDPAPAVEGSNMRISPEEGMRYYKAILGHEPTLDPEAPNLLPRFDEETPARSWTQEVSRGLRDELSRKLHMSLDRRPTWRELMEAMSAAAGRRIDEARRRFNGRNAA